MKPLLVMLSMGSVVCGLATISYGQQSYPLICRGGPSLRFQSHAGNTQHTFNILGLFFQRGFRAAGPDGRTLAPGQCAWVDRGVQSGEPDILQQDVSANVTSQPWMNALKNPNTFWVFTVFNTGQGVMKITGSRPPHGID